MGIMDTRYPAYEVKKGHTGKPLYYLRRLEADRSKGLVVRQDSKFGLFGEVEKIIQVKSYTRLNEGEYTRSGICAENNLYLSVVDENDKETVYRFTMASHLNVIEKYLSKYTKKH